MMQENLRMAIALVVGIFGMWGMIKIGIKVAAKEAANEKKVKWMLKQGYIDY